MHDRLSLSLLIAALAATSGALAAGPIFKRVEADGSVTFTDQPIENAEITVGKPISVIGPTRPVVDDQAEAGPEDSVPEAIGEAPAPPPRPQRAARLARMTTAPEPGVAPPLDAPVQSLQPVSAPTGTRTPSRPVVPDTGAALLELITGVQITAPHDGSMLLDDGELATLLLDAELADSVDGATLATEVLVDGEVVADGPLDRVRFAMPEPGTHVLGARIVDQSGRVLATSASQTVHVKRP